MQNRVINIRCSILTEMKQIIDIVSLTNNDWLNQSAVFYIMIGKINNREKGAGFFYNQRNYKPRF